MLCFSNLIDSAYKRLIKNFFFSQRRDLYHVKTPNITPIDCNSK